MKRAREPECMSLSRHSRSIALLAMLAASLSRSGRVQAQEVFRNTITGEDLKIMETSQPEGRDTEAVKQFLETGVNPYTEVEELPAERRGNLSGRRAPAATAISAKARSVPASTTPIGPIRRTRPTRVCSRRSSAARNGMMGPHNDLQLDEMLRLMAWIRHLYTGPLDDADWLTPEQKSDVQAIQAESRSSERVTVTSRGSDRVQDIRKVIRRTWRDVR